jgi:branched-chain amino acid transport system permease protein
MLRPCGNFNKSYKEDEAIFQTTFIKLTMLLFVILLFFVPFITSQYLLNFISIIGIFIIGAIGLNIMTGFTGIISLGHGAFLGFGAYATAVLLARYNLHLLIALPLGALFAGFLGLITGLASLRIKGMYLAIVTLAVQVIFEFVILEAAKLTGGDLGMEVRLSEPFSLQIGSGQKVFYFLILSILIASIIFARNIFRTKPGRLFIAIRDNDLACQVLGIPVGKYKLLSFWLGNLYAGMAGGLWAAYTGMICPSQFSLKLSLQFLSMILIGGMGSIIGTIFGTIFILSIPELLANISTAIRGMFNIDITTYLSIINNALFGMLIIAFLIYEPYGLGRIWWKTKTYFKLWPFSYTLKH